MCDKFQGTDELLKIEPKVWRLKINIQNNIQFAKMFDQKLNIFQAYGRLTLFTPWKRQNFQKCSKDFGKNNSLKKFVLEKLFFRFFLNY